MNNVRINVQNIFSIGFLPSNVQNMVPWKNGSSTRFIQHTSFASDRFHTHKRMKLAKKQQRKKQSETGKSFKYTWKQLIKSKKLSHKIEVTYTQNENNEEKQDYNT
jgi:hypothetical protein